MAAGPSATRPARFRERPHEPGAKISVFHEGRDQVGESPLWDQQRNALWWVDINGQVIRRKDISKPGTIPISRST